MTANMINYWKLQEDKRHNLAMEQETRRHNVQQEVLGEVSSNAALASAYAAQASAGAAQSQAASRAREVSNDYYFSTLSSNRAERSTQASIDEAMARIKKIGAETENINAQTDLTRVNVLRSSVGIATDATNILFNGIRALTGVFAK